MRHDPTRNAAGTGSAGMPKNWSHIALHTVAAGAFMFLLQRYVMNASLNSSLLWMLVFGACAAGLAYAQSNR